MIRRLCLTLPFLGLTGAFAQDVALPENNLTQAFLDLANDAVVMNISAHPDDEDGSTLAYYRKKFGARTHSILFTRGEGGQNEIGPELYEELAVIRTEETLKAGEILGARVDFLNFPDFGFSNSATEAFRFWGGREEALRRLVFFVRKYKPDILFTNHSTGGGHGHHQAVAVTAIAAFDAAADPEKFPEQLLLSGLSLWQPRKLYLRLFPSTGGRPDVTHRIDEIHQQSGRSYLEIANIALREHRSQGMEGVNMARFTGGVSLYRLARTNSAYQPDTSSFLGGIPLSTDDESPVLRNFRSSIDSMTNTMTRTDLVSRCSRILSGIATRLREGASVREARLLDQWREELENLVIASCQIRIMMTPADSIVVAGQATELLMSITSGGIQIQLSSIRIHPAQGWTMKEGDQEPDALEYRAVLIPDSTSSHTLPRVTQQYRPIEESDVTIAEVDLQVDGFPIRLHRPVTIDVAPPIEFTVSPPSGWLPISRLEEGVEFAFTILNRFPHKIAGTIECRGSGKWQGSPESFLVEKEDALVSGTLVLTPQRGTIAGESIRFITPFASTTAEVRPVDVGVAPGITLGIIRSYDNTIESVARTLAIPHTILNEADLSSGDLSRFSSIVVDIRAYAVRGDLRANNGRLLDYVRQGGNLIVFYQKTQDWKAEYAPYPFGLTRERITDEEAPVTILQPDHPLVNSPNPIGKEDWLGWVQERGVYFPGEVPSEYQRILSSHDPDEPPLDTGLLVTDVGSGSYIFTSYVWYRQMKEANPGSLRMFANMLSYPVYRK